MFVTQRVIELTEAILRKSSGYQAELQTLADEGDQVALYHLGLLLGGPQLGGRHEGLTDHPRAVACFEACLAIPPAKINLGLMLYYGLGAEKDIQRAKRLFVEVIRRHRNCAGLAMFNIALMYRDGDPMPANRRRYGKWLMLAAVHGSPKARALLQKDFRVIVIDNIMVMGLPTGPLN